MLLNIGGDTYIGNAASGNHFYFQSGGVNVFDVCLGTSTMNLTALGGAGNIKIKSSNGTTFTLTVSDAGALVIT